MTPFHARHPHFFENKPAHVVREFDDDPRRPPRRGKDIKSKVSDDGQDQTPTERRASMARAQHLKRVFTNRRRFRRYRHRDLS